MKRYQQNKLELARIEALHDLQQERSIDLMTGDISQKEYDKLQQKINDKLAHFHLSS
jgi:predicted XRE-type DNA-binding protein